MAEQKSTKTQNASSSLNVAVIGCGLVGIVAACGLKKAGFTNVTVYEKRERAGIAKGLWIIFAQNAWYSLNKLELLTEEMKKTQIFNNSKINKYQIGDTNGNIWCETPELDVAKIDPAYNATPVFRDEMLERFLTIASELDVKIEFGKKLIEIGGDDDVDKDNKQNKDKQHCLKFEDGSIVDDVDLILACDGIHSAIRRKYFTNETYNASNDLNFLNVYAFSFFSRLDSIDTMGMLYWYESCF